MKTRILLLLALSCCECGDGVWGRVWGQTGSFPYSESPQSLSVKRVLSNKYQKTFRLSPISVPDFHKSLGYRLTASPDSTLRTVFPRNGIRFAFLYRVCGARSIRRSRFDQYGVHNASVFSPV